MLLWPNFFADTTLCLLALVNRPSCMILILTPVVSSLGFNVMRLVQVARRYIFSFLDYWFNVITILPYYGFTLVFVLKCVSHVTLCIIPKAILCPVRIPFALPFTCRQIPTVRLLMTSVTTRLNMLIRVHPLVCWLEITSH